MLVNLKVTGSRNPARGLTAAVNNGAGVVFLDRPNLLEQVVSWRLAVQRRYHPELGDRLHDNHRAEGVAAEMAEVRQTVVAFRAAVAARPALVSYEELIYGQLGNAANVAAVLGRAFGLPDSVVLRAPVTEKVGPPVVVAAPWLVGVTAATEET